MDDKHPLDGQIEPAAEAFAKSNPAMPAHESATMSIAISLKRIADAMTETNEYGEGTAAAVGGNLRRAMQSIESAIFSALNGRR